MYKDKNDLLSTNRLSILITLSQNGWTSFNTFKEKLSLTDGNLSSQMRALKEHKIVKIRKRFVGLRPETSYAFTSHGRNLWQAYTAFIAKELGFLEREKDK